MKPQLKNLSAAFMGGALLCTIGDTAHVAFQVDGYYPSPFNLLPWGVPVWVPLEFGVASVIMVGSHQMIFKKGASTIKSSLTQVSLSAIYFLSLYLFSAVSKFQSGGWKDLIMAFFALMLWGLNRFHLKSFFLAGSSAVIGTVVEILFVHSGGFYYHPGSANFYGVPSWLPWLYFTASIAVSAWVRLPLKSSS